MAELRTMLEPVVGTRLVGRLWADEDLRPGDRWREDIVRQLHRTRVAVLLVSKEFLASEFIREVELSYFLKRADQDEVTLLWVPVNHTLYEHSPLSAIQAVLPPDRPLMAERGAARELALKRVAEAIQAAYA